jgi:hypothetical protein
MFVSGQTSAGMTVSDTKLARVCAESQSAMRWMRRTCTLAQFLMTA